MPVKQHTDLRDLSPNTYIDGIYGLYNPQLGVTRSGKTFLKCLLRDATGEIAARQWSYDERGFGDIESTGFVEIAGYSQLHNGQIQLIIEQIRATTVSEDEIPSLLPTSRHDLNEMFAEVKRLLGTLEHPAMTALAETYFADEELMRRFRLAPAATAVHHAWIGGLLEHTLQVMKLADAALPLYPDLNRDLVLMGLFLHDLGKTAELSWDQGFSYTHDGNLVGHVVRGAIWLQVKAAIAGKNSGHKLSPDAIRCLQHIILSHHGEPEYGAAKCPSTPEAIFVAILDNLDAKTQIALTVAKRGDAVLEEASAPFTDRIAALKARIYRPDPLGEC